MPADRALSGSLTGYYSALPDQPNLGMAVGSVNVGALRFEGRYNYEARASASAFVGWKFEGGDEIAWEVTPLIGTLFGRTRGVVPGFEAAVSWKSFDFYIEAEYVFDRQDSDANYAYAWSELGWTPVEWLRVGLVGQRTRVVDNDRDHPARRAAAGARRQGDFQPLRIQSRRLRSVRDVLGRPRLLRRRSGGVAEVDPGHLIGVMDA